LDREKDRDEVRRSLRPIVEGNGEPGLRASFGRVTSEPGPNSRVERDEPPASREFHRPSWPAPLTKTLERRNAKYKRKPCREVLEAFVTVS